MAGGLTLWTTMTALTGLAGGFISLAILRMGVALGEAVSVPATHSLLSDKFPFERRGRAFSIWALASPVGVTAGIALGGWLSDHLEWRESFLFIGLAGFAMVPLLLFLREPQRGRFERQAGSEPPLSISFRAGCRYLWNRKSFRLLVIAATLHSYSYQAVMIWMPPFLARSHDLSMTQIAIWSAIMVGLGGGIGALAGGQLIDRLVTRDIRSYAWAPGIATFILVPFAGVQYLASSLSITLAAGFFSLIAASFFIAPVNALAQSMVQANLRGLTSAILLVFPTGIGLGLGPLLTGGCSDLFVAITGNAELSLRLALILALSGSLIASVFFWRLGVRLGEENETVMKNPGKA
ncbi:MFS transporter [Sphingobium sp. EM0848]|nr:MFS transporter [Sphingobium sp. EM0848]